MSGIRVTYSGLISFSLGLTKIITGLVFMTIVTRLLSAEEFGTWTLINGILFYGIVLDPIISYWSTREIARNKNFGKTAFAGEGLLSIGGIIIYFISVLIIVPQTNIEYNVLLFAVILIPPMYLNKVLSSINAGWKPQTVSYANFFSEIIKIPLILLFIFYFDMGVIGVIIAYFIGWIINDLALLWYARGKIRDKLNMEIFKKWMKIFWLSLYPRIAPLIERSDVILFTLITGSVIGLAYYSSALIIGGLVGFAGAFSAPVYGKLLGDGKKEYLSNNLTLQIYLMVLLSGLSVIFAKIGLFTLNPIYQIAVPIVIIITIRIFFQTLNLLFVQILTGLENVDVKNEPTFKEYIKSKLVFVPTIKVIQAGMYITLLTFVLIFMTNKVSEIELVQIWTLVALIIEIPFTLILFLFARKNVKLLFESSRIIKFILSGIIVFTMTYIITEKYITYKNEIISFIPHLLIFIMIGISGYLIITGIIDKKIGNLYKSIFHEIKKSM